MEEQLRKIFKQFQGLTPSADFVLRSKTTILMTPQKAKGFSLFRSRFFESMKFSTALTLASVLMFILVGSFSYLNSTTNNQSLASSTALMQEASNLNFQIQIKEATYFTQTARQVALALDEVAKGAPAKSASSRSAVSPN